MSHVTREYARRFICPQCKARAGEKCRRRNGAERESNHLPRVDASRRYL
ncbi:zinc finger domain-containing protein [Streptomyces rosealbus]